METEKPLKVKGVIVKKHNLYNFTAYVEEFDKDICVVASAKIAMCYYDKLIVGSKLIIDVSPYDRTKGRVTRQIFNL